MGCVCCHEKLQACSQAIAAWRERRRLAKEAKRARERQRLADVITEMYERNRSKKPPDFASEEDRQRFLRRQRELARQEAEREASRQERKRRRESAVTWHIPNSIREGNSPSSSMFNVSNLDQVSASRYSGSDSSGAVEGELHWTEKVLLCYRDFKIPRPTVRPFEEGEDEIYLAQCQDMGVTWPWQ